jgi:hypothetical protein
MSIRNRVAKPEWDTLYITVDIAFCRIYLDNLWDRMWAPIIELGSNMNSTAASRPHRPSEDIAILSFLKTLNSIANCSQVREIIAVLWNDSTAILQPLL